MEKYYCECCEEEFNPTEKEIINGGIASQFCSDCAEEYVHCSMCDSICAIDDVYCGNCFDAR